jgi:hypothetical protein
MLDIETNLPIKVSTDGDAGPYLLVPMEQLEEVREALERRQISFTLGEDAIELDGSPVIAIVDFGRDADPARIQEALDAV